MKNLRMVKFCLVITFASIFNAIQCSKLQELPEPKIPCKQKCINLRESCMTAAAFGFADHDSCENLYNDCLAKCK